MSISNFLNIPVNPRLEFGISLDRVCDRGVLHPGLRELFLKAYLSACGDDSIEVEEGVDDDTLPPVMYALRPGTKGQGLVSERIKLKAKLEAGKWIVSAQTPPGAPLWLLRHFLGRLPTPLLRGSHWSMLAIACGAASRPDAESHVAQVLERIVAAIEAMSAEAYYTLSALVLLIRNLTMERNREGRDVLHEEAVDALSQYFTAAIITRPYRPGLYTALDREHQPLLVFLAKRWLEIKRSLRNLRSTSNNTLRKLSIFNTLRCTPTKAEELKFKEPKAEELRSKEPKPEGLSSGKREFQNHNRGDQKAEINTKLSINFSQGPKKIKEAIKVRFIRSKKIMVDKACGNFKCSSKTEVSTQKQTSKHKVQPEKKFKGRSLQTMGNVNGTQTFECEFPDKIDADVPERRDRSIGLNVGASPNLRKIESCPTFDKLSPAKMPEQENQEYETTTHPKLSTEDEKARENDKFMVVLESNIETNSSKKMLIYRLASSRETPAEVSEYFSYPNSGIKLDRTVSSEAKLGLEKGVLNQSSRKSFSKGTNTTPSFEDFLDELKEHFKTNNTEENHNLQVDANGNITPVKFQPKGKMEGKHFLTVVGTKVISKSTSLQLPRRISVYQLDKRPSLPEESKAALFNYTSRETAKCSIEENHTHSDEGLMTNCPQSDEISMLKVMKLEGETRQKTNEEQKCLSVVKSSFSAHATSSPLSQRLSVYRLEGSIDIPNKSDSTFFTCSNSKLSLPSLGQTTSKSKRSIDNPPSYEDFAQELRNYFKEAGD